MSVLLRTESLPNGNVRLVTKDDKGHVWTYDIASEEWEKAQQSLHDQQTRASRESGVEVTEVVCSSWRMPE